MKRIKTFIDASLLIAAARGNQDISDRALEVLDDPGRSYVTSDFVRLEVLPKAVFHQREAEVHFYRTFFARAKRTIKATAPLVAQGQQEAEQAGLSAVGRPACRSREEGEMPRNDYRGKAGQAAVSRGGLDHQIHPLVTAV